MRNVVIYARVSTEHEAQISALGNQLQYYQNIVQMHDDWNLVDTYVDEGITGTSVKKRKAFSQMLSDAELGKFDLIITREVSRFARNTVDTLQKTRELKKIGVEVYFTDDNIWTMQDEDGELRLTIMATLAQNESKKTSMRVKAGQAVSFQNGVIYGNGNILGYDRTKDGFAINEEQAETVRMIFDLYEKGNGMREISYRLEKAGRLTAMGLPNWDTATISRILKNSFYCGIIEYRKEFVPDYLEQKKIKNNGEVEKIYYESDHPKIVTKEQYEHCREIRNERYQSGSFCRKPESIWTKKLRCKCGGKFHRMPWNKKKDGTVVYGYYCYKQKKTGTVSARAKRGLSTEGICTAPMFSAWKIEICAMALIKRIMADKDIIIGYAEQMLDESIQDSSVVLHQRKIDQLKSTVAVKKRQSDRLLDLYLAGGIEIEDYEKRRKLFEDEIGKLDNEKSEEESLLGSLTPDEDNKKSLISRVAALKENLDNICEFDYAHIPDSIIDAVIESIIVDDCTFSITLRGNGDVVKMKIPQKKTKVATGNVSGNNLLGVFDSGTGSNCSEVGY